MILPAAIVGLLLFNSVKNNKQALEDQGNTRITQLASFLEYSWEQAKQRYASQVDRYIETKNQDNYCATRSIKIYSDLHDNTPIKIWDAGESPQFKGQDSIVAKVTHRYAPNLIEICCREEIPEKYSKNSNYRFATTFSELLVHTKNGGFFDILGVYNSNGTPLYVSDKTLRISPLAVDSLMGSSQSIGIQRSHINISGTKYYSYSLPVKLENKTLFVCGFIKDKRFLLASRRLSFIQVSILVFAILLILSSFPILRIVLASKADYIKKSHVYSMGFSMVFTTLVVGIFFSTYMTSYKIENHEKSSHLKKIKDLSSLFFSGVEDLSMYLTHINTTSQFREEVITTNRKNGEASVKLKDGKEIYTNLKERHYVQNAKYNKRLYLGSHLSLSSGEIESVLSYLTNSEDTVMAVTFDTDAILQDFNKDGKNEDLKYLLIKSDGKIFYRSPAIKTYFQSIDEALGGEQALAIKDLMASPVSNNPIEIPLFLNGYHFEGNLSRLYPSTDNKAPSLQDPMWILTFNDLTVQYFRSYTGMLMSFLGYAFYILIVILLMLIAFFAQAIINTSSSSEHSYSWFRPNTRCYKEYNILIVVMLIHIIWLFVLSMMQSNLFIIILCCAEVAVFISLFNYVLLSGYWQRKKENTLHNGDYFRTISNVILLAVLLGLLIMVHIHLGDFGRAAVPLIMVSVVHLGLCVLVLPFNMQASENRLKIVLNKSTFSRKLNGQQQFYLCFTLWVIIFGLIPGFVIHHTAAHLENEIWEETVYLQGNKATINQSWLIDRFEYTRRNFINNFSGLNSKAVTRYLTPDPKTFSEALTHSEGLRTNVRHYLNPVTFLMLLLIILMHPITAYLHKLVYLYPLKVFKQNELVPISEMGFYEPFLFVETLDPMSAMHQLNYENDSVIVINLSSPNRTQVLNQHAQATIDPRRVVLLHSQCCSKKEDLQALISYISHRYLNKLPLTIFCSYDLRAVELSVKRNSSIEHEYLMTVSEVLAPFVSTWIPIGGVYQNSTALYLQNEFVISQLSLQILANIKDKLATIENNHKQGNHHSENLQNAFMELEKVHLGHYLNTWQELSFSEKKMIYNQACEGYVNFKNIKVARALIRKGIMVFDVDNLSTKLFNNGFTEFVKVAPSKEMREDFIKDSWKNGNNKNIRYAMITLVFIALFIYSWLNAGSYDRLIKILTGSMALISTVLGLFANISGKGLFSKSASSG